MARLVASDADPEAVRTAVQQAGIKSFGSLENLLTAYDTIHRYLLDNYKDEAFTPVRQLDGRTTKSASRPRHNT